jgi:uncharacterized heparinase superfamily protein
MRLKGRHPLKLLSSPDSPFVGSDSRGQLILEGKFFRAGQEIEAGPSEIWQIAERATPDFFSWLHGFSWLEDLAALKDEAAARAAAEDLVRSWADTYHPYHRDAWRPDLAGTRVVNWTVYAPFILSSADLVYRSLVLNSLAQQGRHLAITWMKAPVGPRRAQALLGLAASGALLPNGETRLAKALGAFERLARDFILADGGPKSRSIVDVAEFAYCLVLLRTILEDRQGEVPGWLQLTLDKIMPFLKSMTHGNQSAARFGDYLAARPYSAKQLQKHTRTRGGPISNATLTGYLRLQQSKFLLLMDVGPPAEGRASLSAAAGTLSIELSEASECLVVNGVCPPEFDDQTSDAARPCLQRTAAHSTLVLGNRDSTAVQHSGRLGPGVSETRFERNENEEGIWVEAVHDGYRRKFGYKHQRRLFLSAAGTDLRGEDRLEPAPVGWRSIFGRPKPAAVAVYFQLHPDVTASLTQEGTVAILRLASNKGWMFKVRGGEMGIEEGVFFDGPGFGVRTSRIVVRTQSGSDGLIINWSFKRIGSRE